ncbi:MAG TPA: hypothetical protein VKT72_17045 [Candidatus Baltobacteraceae bacterium]|nr:hypothetical protein [Candidatus Baltobacteraceae bacterium]
MEGGQLAAALLRSPYFFIVLRSSRGYAAAFDTLRVTNAQIAAQAQETLLRVYYDSSGGNR